MKAITLFTTIIATSLLAQAQMGAAPGGASSAGSGTTAPQTSAPNTVGNTNTSSGLLSPAGPNPSSNPATAPQTSQNTIYQNYQGTTPNQQQDSLRMNQERNLQELQRSGAPYQTVPVQQGAPVSR